MRVEHRWLVVLVLAALAVVAAGCWDRWEIEDRGFVMGVAMDLGTQVKGPGGKDRPVYRVTLQMVQPAQVAAGGGGAKGGAFWNLTAASTSVKGAVWDMLTRSDRRPYFEDMRVMIIGEELARHGIAEAMDYWTRHPEVRWKVRVYVAAGEGQKALGVMPLQEPVNAIYLADLARNEVRTMRFSPVKDMGMVVTALNTGSTLVLPRVEVGQEDVKLSGGAVFKHGRLVGWLDDKETEGLRMLRNQVKGGTLPVYVRGEEYVLDLTEVRTRLHPRIRDGKLTFHAEVRVEANLGEDQSLRYSMDTAYFTEIQQAAVGAIRTRMNGVLARAQQDMNADIFNFGREVEIRYPGVWKQIAGRWDEIFPTVEVEVRSQVYVRRIGVVK